MWAWLIDHWYVVWGGFCCSLILIGHMVFRRNPGSSSARIFYAVFSNLDPLPEAVAERNAQLVRSMMIIGAGLLVIGAFLIVVWLFSKVDVVS
jgi:hypothetical protein